MIEVQRFSKRFGENWAASDISFQVKEGEVFAFLGPNGSGKTTTLRSMVGLTVPTSGRILINGVDVRKFPRETKRFMSYLPQRVVFPDNCTAREVIDFFCRIRDLPPGRAEGVMQAYQFADLSGQYVGEFSGGMIQRLGLAVAALPDAPILLLDEPTANLDPQGVKRFREFIMHQKENGKTILFSTHLLHEVEQLADRVGVFVNGRLAAVEYIDSLRRTYRATTSIEDMYLHYVEKRDYERN